LFCHSFIFSAGELFGFWGFSLSLEIIWKNKQEFLGGNAFLWKHIPVEVEWQMQIFVMANYCWQTIYNLVKI